MTKILKTFLVLACVLAMPSLSLLAATGDGPTLLPQITGVQDDGSPEGVVKSKLTRGQLVKMPFVDGKYSLDNVFGTAGASYNKGAGQVNSDGTGTQLFVSVPTTSALRIVQTFYGTVFGVRWFRNATDFAVVIDGVAYRVTSTLKEPETASAITSAAEFENLTVVADDLPDGPHVAEFVFTNPTGGTLTWNLHGYLVEARAGHGTFSRVAGVANATTVPATATAIMDVNFKSLRKVFYWNTDTVTRTVTIKQNDLTIEVITLPAASGATFDPGDFVALQSTATGASSFGHVCDLAGKVNFLPIGGL